MKLKFLDYIPYISWVNTTRRSIKLKNKLDQKVSNVSANALTKKEICLKFFKIAATFTPFIGNVAIGVYALAKFIIKKKDQANFPIPKNIRKIITHDKVLLKKYKNFIAEIRQDPIINKTGTIDSAEKWVRKLYLLEIYQSKFQDNDPQFNLRFPRVFNCLQTGRKDDDTLLQGRTEGFLQQFNELTLSTKPAALFFYLSQQKEMPIHKLNALLDEDLIKQGYDNADVKGNTSVSRFSKATSSSISVSHQSAGVKGNASVNRSSKAVSSSVSHHSEDVSKQDISKSKEDSVNSSKPQDIVVKPVVDIDEILETMSQELSELKNQDILFHEFHDKLATQFNTLFFLINSKKMWFDPRFEPVITQFMECGYRSMQMYLEDIKKLGNTPSKMAYEMAMQPQIATKTNCKGKGAYCHPFFQGNIIDLYHRARDLYFVKETGLNDWGRTEYTFISNPKTKEDIEPFFKKGTPQNEWRLLYNKTCDLFDKSLRKALKKEDGRFINWSQKDTSKKTAYLSCDTKPT